MKKASELFDLRDTFELVKETNHEFEYQEVCTELEKDFSKLVWTLPFKKGYSEFNLKKAAGIARKKGILKFNYLVGILKKL